MIDETIRLKNSTPVQLHGDDRLNARAIIQGGKGEVSHFLLVGTISTTEDNSNISDTWLNVLLEIELHSESTAQQVRLLRLFVNWIIEEVANEFGLEDEDNEPADEYHWRSFSLTKL